MLRTAVAIVAYPATNIEAYAAECLTSLAAQTDRNFSLFIFNDGLRTLRNLTRGRELEIGIVEATGSPARIRRNAIRHLLDLGYEMIVFADIDDYFDKRRIEISKRMLTGGAAIVCNELMLCGERYDPPVPMLGMRLAEGDEISAADLDAGNCLGMSNTAIRCAAIPSSALAGPDTVTAFDWLFFSRILRSGPRARFTAATVTYYRQHASNTARVRNLSDGDILRGLEIKRQHYAALSGNPADLARAQAFTATQQKLSGQARLAARYYEAVRNSSTTASFWWEPIKTLEEMAL